MNTQIFSEIVAIAMLFKKRVDSYFGIHFKMSLENILRLLRQISYKLFHSKHPSLTIMSPTHLRTL